MKDIDEIQKIANNMSKLWRENCVKTMNELLKIGDNESVTDDIKNEILIIAKKNAILGTRLTLFCVEIGTTKQEEIHKIKNAYKEVYDSLKDHHTNLGILKESLAKRAELQDVHTIVEKLLENMNELNDKLAELDKLINPEE